MNKFYITSSLPYTNAPAHIGHLLEFIQADVLTRYNRLLGNEVFFLTGTDEHGRKNVQAAEKKEKSPQEFVNEISAGFKELTKIAGISIDKFVRTTDQFNHWPAVHKIWKKLRDNGDLYKAEYEGLYCIGHEAFIKKSELKDGLCLEHQTEPEKIKEENYFFKLSKYKNQIEKLIQEDKIKILPVHRKNETLKLIKDSEDVSASRPKESISWGVPVPGDSGHIIYIWLEALISYLSGIGYADETEVFKKFWPPDIQIVGKDIMRFHTIIWPAMLLAAGLELPKSIYVHGFITVDGQKMSKTIGNVTDPFDLVKKYGVDPIRYYLLREISSYEDGDWSEKKFEARYNADLANNLGNLVSRVVALIEKFFNGSFSCSRRFVSKEIDEKVIDTWKKYNQSIDNFKLHIALENVFSLVGFANLYIDEHKPWAISGNPEKLNIVMTNLIVILLNVAWLLKPFLPETSSNIFEILGADKDGKSWEEKPFQVRPRILFPKI
ncbi:MAG: methionine--tRNA ligase [Parcubacteria group bacterium RIFCSPLOWO2_01_FULL_40_65]|nr:MAG: methionine--tRNA ligase [Parcubacteria group bacterium RIFCSPHIGHO2_01_FULL_40_30]OHB19444.1 MAG: methionine--tRNA ligase [Parcubacteria group bacterium RIFCSPHIGHO2_02_FULL_40_12]OHB21604.1 MAG: methionine--tRNA ligase [Parcubacteria group bacterium RIFCSPLOWO2_01_FULL_40_65]OHB23473.1 MAG: methionine--tRNA ligase [Parcubacteria group bacterium RIFCSPLOWO2_02_FULL_40_12]OHB23715.1 MAG: methionine--tRNA ligase [Parcubacteria group bacterium RIFCSPLOWO2_12_FULL_40_10]